MPDLYRLRDDSLRAFWWAQVEACGRHDEFCGIADVLHGIVLAGESITSEYLSKAGYTAVATRPVFILTADEAPILKEGITFTPNVIKTIILAFDLADELGYQKVDCVHILYSLLNEPMVEDIREILQALKVDPEQLRSELLLRLRDIN